MIHAIKRSAKIIHHGYYNYLLISLALLFLMRPYNVSVGYNALWKLLFTFAIVSATFNCKLKKTAKWTSVILAIPTLLFSWSELIVPSEWLFATSVICIILFLIATVSFILSDVLLYAKVTTETLRGVVCVYFLIAFLFAYSYYLIEYFSPGSFHLIYRDASFVTYSRDLSEMMYFSFVTLLTIGFGDVTPILNIAQSAVVLEGIVGEFYVAILVARIVAVYSRVSVLHKAHKRKS